MSKSETSEDAVVLDRVEVTSAKRVKGMPYVLALSTASAVLVLIIATIAFL
jgi:hypothetical protein